jgi:zinc transport system substrate-binding protein
MIAAAILPLVLIATLAGGCGGSKGDGAGDKVKVAVSIAPLADFVKQVGGERVEVELMVPSGSSPHTYEPTTAQMKFLSEASLLVLNGLELEAWAAEVLGNVGNSGLVKVECASYIPEADLITAGADEHEQEGETDEHEQENGIYDPHVWLDPELAAYQVEAIRDALIETDAEHAREYRGNAAAYIGQLESLDAWIREQVDSFERKNLVAFHSAWNYFARRYGLGMVGVVEELPGKEPSAADIVELVEAIRAEGVTVVLAEPQFSTRAAEAVAEASGGEVKVAIVDPLGDPDDPAVNTYDKLLRHDVEEMEKALG